MLVVQIFNHSRFAHNQVSDYGRDIAVLSCALSDYVVSVMHDNVDLWSIVGLDVSRVCIYHHHEGVRVETELWSSWVFQADCRAGMCRGVNEVARVTCEYFMAETDTHVLRIVNGIWVGKIVFLIFRICVNKNMFHKHFSNSSFLKWWFYTCLK